MPTFDRPQPLSLRIWHWLDALAITLLLATVLLRKTFLSWRENSAFLQERLGEAGVAITPELAKELAVGIRAPMWEWHYRLGFALTGLLLLRIGIAVVRPTERPFSAALSALRGLRAAPVDQRPAAAHLALVKGSYAVAYVAIAFMVGSGLTMRFADTLGVGEGLADGLKEVHEQAMWFFVAFAAAHPLGVVVDELRHRSGLVSAMIHGGRS